MMEVKEYCDNMRAELSNWKNEIRDILNAVDVFPESDKKLLSSQIATLRDLVSDISGRIDRVKDQCPLDWGAASAKLQRSVEELRKSAASMWDFDHIAGGYVGG